MDAEETGIEENKMKKKCFKCTLPSFPLEMPHINKTVIISITYAYYDNYLQQNSGSVLKAGVLIFHPLPHWKI